MAVVFITPWYGATQHLLPEYRTAVQGGRVIVIDNGTPPETAQALQQAAKEDGWLYHRPSAGNIGFASANNLGVQLIGREMAEITPDDVVCFLNSDVRGNGLAFALSSQVGFDALIGPSLQYQLVAGRWLPYIEGWCIAGTLRTIERLSWPAWPDPYWEDNAYCLGALRSGIALVHTALPVQHIGGQSAGGLMRHGRGFEKNRAAFVKLVFAALDAAPDVPKTGAFLRFQHELTQPSDIQHHLPLLYSLARGTVVELGTRTGVSTAAFLAGVERSGGTVTSIDLDDVSGLYRGHPQWRCVRGSSIDPGTAALVEGRIDVLLVDTEHFYEQVAAELALWGPRMRAGGVVLFHDPETFPGVRAAIRDWCAENRLSAVYVLPNNGMAVVRIDRELAADDLSWTEFNDGATVEAKSGAETGGEGAVSSGAKG